MVYYAKRRVSLKAKSLNSLISGRVAAASARSLDSLNYRAEIDSVVSLLYQ